MNKCDINSGCQFGSDCRTTFGSYYCDCPNNRHGQVCDKEAEGGKSYLKGPMVFYPINYDRFWNREIDILVQEVGDEYKLIIDDGMGYKREFGSNDFSNINIKEKCTNLLQRKAQYIDPEVCARLPDGAVLGITVPLRYPIASSLKNNLISKIDMKKYPLLGRVDPVKIIMQNYGEDEFIESYPIMTVYDPETIECQRDVLFEGCSQNNQNPTIYNRGSTIYLKVSSTLIYECLRSSPEEHLWKMFNPENGKQITAGDKQPDISNQRGARFNKYQLDINTYMMEVEIKERGNFGSKKEIVSFNRCWFKIDYFKPTARVTKDNYEIECNGEISIDSSLSYDPNNPGSNTLEFSLKCNKPNEAICKEKISKDKIHHIKGFKCDQTYIYTLKVTSIGSNTEPDYKQITVKVLPKNELNIECMKNCKTKSIPDEAIYLVAKEKYIKKEDRKFEWSIKEEGGADISLDSIRETSEKEEDLIIKPNSLKKGTKYTVTVKKQDMIATYNLITYEGPKTGTCSVDPPQVVMGNLVNVSCNGFESADDPKSTLKYEVYKVHDDPDKSVLVGYDYKPEIKDIKIDSPDLMVKVIDNNGLFVTENIKVEVTDSPKQPTESCSDEEIDYVIGKVNEYAKDKNIALALKELQSFVDTRLSLDCLDGLSKTRVLSILGKLDPKDVAEIRQASLIIYDMFPTKEFEKYAHKNNGYEERIILYAGIITKMLSQNLYEKSEIKEEKYYSQNDIINIAKLLVQATDGVFKIKDEKIVDENIREEESEIHFQKIKKGISEFTKAFEKMGDALRNAIESPKAELTIKTEDMTMYLKLAGTELFKDVIHPPENVTPASIKFDKEFIESYLKTSLFLEVVQINKNPLWFANESISTDLLYVYVAEKLGNVYKKVHDVKGSINLYFDVKQKQPLILKGTTYNPADDLTPDEKDKAVTVHRLDIWNGRRGLLSLESQEYQLRIVILEDLRPDFDHFENAKNLSTKIQHSISDEKDQIFVYVGVLPEKKAQTQEEVSYTIEGYNIFCKIWGDGIWVSGPCEVGPEFTPERIHCVCNHLSLFSAALLAPFNKIDFIQDFNLFSTLHNNFYVFAMVITLLVLLIILIIWGVIKDRKDKARRTVIILEDNYPTDEYNYLVAVYTGHRLFSGTTAHIGIKLYGTNAESNAHILQTPVRSTLKRSYDDWFLIFTQENLGAIKYIEIWHDETGKNPDWYCRKIYIYDLSDKTQYIFQIQQWISISYSKNMHPGFFLYTFYTLGEESKTQLLKNNAIQGFQEKHNWSSILLRHPRSLYTRPQRAIIAFNFILSTMLISMLFFGIKGGPADNPEVNVTIREVIISIYSVLLSIPLIKLVAICFQKSNFLFVTRKERKMTFNMNEFRRILKEGAIFKRMLKTSLYVIGYILTPTNLIPVELVERTSKKKRKIMLILSWILAITVLLVCSIVIIYFGLIFGKNKSLLWLTTYIFGVLQNGFLFDPFKIIVISIVLATVFKKTYVENYIIDTADIMPLRTKLSASQSSMKRWHPMYKPIPLFTLKEKRRKRYNRVIIIHFITELIIISLLLIAVVAITYLVDIRSKFYSNAHIYDLVATEEDKSQNLEFLYSFNTFKENRNKHIMPEYELISSEYQKRGLIRIYNKTNFLEFLLHRVLPNMHYLKWYNGSFLELEGDESADDLEKFRADSYIKGFTKDYSTKLIGVPRLRQMRVAPNHSSYVPGLFKPWYEYRVGLLNIFNEETSALRPGWERLPRYYKEPPIWSYETYNASESVGMFGYSGLFYGRGGYVESLDRTLGKSQRKLISLAMNDWFDNYTRVVFFEANLFNVNNKFLSTVTIIAEHLPNGVYLTRANVEVSYLFSEGQHFSRFVISTLTMVLIIIILIMIALKALILMSLFGTENFFSNWWMLNDVFIVVVGIIMVVGYFRSSIYYSIYMEILERDKGDIFTSFYVPLHYLLEAYMLMGLFSILATVRCLNFVRIKGAYSILEKLVSTSAVPILILFIVFLFFGNLLLLLSSTWNFPLLHKYIIFPVYNNYYLNKEKYSFHHVEYIPVIFAYLLATIAVLIAIILISKYKKAMTKQKEEDKKIMTEGRDVPDLILEELISGNIIHHRNKNKTLRLNGGYEKRTSKINRKYKKTFSSENEKQITKNKRTVIEAADAIIDQTTFINIKLKMLLDSL